MIVYLVQGYDLMGDNYYVHCVCSTREEAEYAKRFYNSEIDIEEHVLDGGVPEHPRGLFAFTVKLDKEGNDLSGWQEPGMPPYWVAGSLQPGGNGCVWFHVWGRDMAHAVRRANAQRAALVGSGRWDEAATPISPSDRGGPGTPGPRLIK